MLDILTQSSCAIYLEGNALIAALGMRIESLYYVEYRASSVW